MMKSLVPFACVLLSIPLSAAEVDPLDQKRLINLEMKLGLRKAEGYGANHPTIRRLETNIRMIEKRVPDVRNDAYAKMLRTTLLDLEEQRDRMIDGGMGENHPGRVETERQLAAAEKRLAELKK